MAPKSLSTLRVRPRNHERLKIEGPQQPRSDAFFFWHSDPSIIIDDDTTVVILPSSTGISSYTFEVEDNFGCSYDTTINVFVTPGPTMLGDTSICDVELQYIGMTATNGGEWSYSGSGNLTFSNPTPKETRLFSEIG